MLLASSYEHTAHIAQDRSPVSQFGVGGADVEMQSHLGSTASCSMGEQDRRRQSITRCTRSPPLSMRMQDGEPEQQVRAAKAQKSSKRKTPDTVAGQPNGATVSAQPSSAKGAKRKVNGSVTNGAGPSSEPAPAAARSAAISIDDTASQSEASADDSDEASESSGDEGGPDDDVNTDALSSSGDDNDSDSASGAASDSGSDILTGAGSAPIEDLKLNINGRGGGKPARRSGSGGVSRGGGVDESLPIAERYKHLKGVRIVEDMEQGRRGDGASKGLAARAAVPR